MTMDCKPKGEYSYNSCFECLNQSLILNGRKSLYSGLGFTLLSAIPYSLFLALCMKSVKKHDRNGEFGVNAGIAVAAHILFYPFDTIRRNLQANGLVGNVYKYDGSVKCMCGLYNSKMLLNGLPASLGKFGLRILLQWGAINLLV